jgi:hypothetical protein
MSEIEIQNQNMDNVIIKKEKKPTSQAQKDAVKRYYAKNKDNQEFKDKIKECCTKYNNAHKEEINERAKAYSKKFYAENKEIKLQKVKEYQAKKKIQVIDIYFPTLN